MNFEKMTFETGFHVDVDPMEMLKALYLGRSIPERIREGAEAAVSLCGELIEPSIIYIWADVEETHGETVTVRSLESGRRAEFHLGPNAGFLSCAEKILVSVSTIGRKLDLRISELGREGDAFTGYLMDCAGVVGLSHAGDRIKKVAENTARELGWGLGYRLSPGSLKGWDLTGQADLCSLLDIDRIGVSLSDSGILSPHKSVSGVIAMGPELGFNKVGSACKYCEHVESCWRANS